MTVDPGLKTLIRARMAETGEHHTIAREAILADKEAARKFYQKTIRSFFSDGRLNSLPAKRRARMVVLSELLQLFAPGVEYPEREVNERLRQVHEDVAYLRRELVNYGFMTRRDSRYRLAAELPDFA